MAMEHRVMHVFRNSYLSVRQTSCVSQGLRHAATAANSEGDTDAKSLASAKPFEEMPKIPCLPVIGSSWVYFPIIGRYDKRRLHFADRHKNQTYGDVIREKIGKLDLIYSFNPKDMQTLLDNEGKYPVRTDLQSIKAYRESRKQWYKTVGVSLLNGEEWHHIRSKAQKHLMRPQTIISYLSPMEEVASELVKSIQSKRDSNREVPNFLNELYKWGIESIALVGLDTRLGAFSNSAAPDSDAVRLINAVQTMIDLFIKLEPVGGTLPFWKYFPTPAWRRYVKAGDTFTEIAFKYINRALDGLKNKSEDEELSVLEKMLFQKELDTSEIMVMVADMLMAGIDTTAHSVGYLLYHLAKNPEKQEILFDILATSLPNKDDKITPEIFNTKLVYLKSCMKESMRLDPVVRGHGRTLSHDVVISGYRVPAKTFIIVGYQQIYKNEQYFKNAEQFWPERWLSPENKPEIPMAFLPFGIGVRSCIGQRLAHLEMICLAAKIVRNFRVEYHHEDIGMITRAVNAPDRPLRLTFIDR